MNSELFIIFFGAMLANNFVLYRFLGICPFIGVSKRTNAAFGMGIAVTFVMTLSTIITWLVYHKLLAPLNLKFMQIVCFILVIASLVQLIELFMQKKLPWLHKAFGIYLPLITTNCAILGLALLNILNKYSFLESVVFAFGAGLGFIIALLIMSGIRERLELSSVPPAFRGVPIAFIVAALLSIAFAGFGGLI